MNYWRRIPSGSLLLLFVLLISSGFLSRERVVRERTGSGKVKTLIFHEDFEGNELNWKIWRLEEQANPNWKKFLSDDPNGVPIKDGNVLLRAEWDKDEERPKTWGISTKDKFSFAYGEIQVRAKFTKTGKGAWPAIWLMPQTEVYKGWPDGGEIDIMERIDDKPIIYHAWHIKGKSGEGRAGDDIVDFNGYNIYGLKKYKDRLEYSINGVNTYTLYRKEIAPEIWPFDTDWYLILNHATADDGKVGATWWPELIDDPEQLPYEMAVDWVKVYSFE